MKNQKYIFYYGKSNKVIPIAKRLAEGYNFKVWKPRIYKITPRGLFRKEFLVWWLLHYLRFFANSNSNYRIFIIYCNKTKEIAHYSVVLPKYFKTSFMGKDDLQIGPIDTREDHRRKGLASYTIQRILEFYKDQNPRFWYIVREENEISKGYIKKIGFVTYGEGGKKKRFGIKTIDTFIIEKKY